MTPVTSLLPVKEYDKQQE